MRLTHPNGRWTVAARGPTAAGLLALVVFALLFAPRLLVPMPDDAALRDSIRALQGREIGEIFRRRLEAASGTHASDETAAGGMAARTGKIASADAAAVGAAWAAALERLGPAAPDRLRVKRSWLGPPFARRWSYLVEVHSGTAAGVYRVRGGVASRTGPVWWRVPLF